MSQKKRALKAKPRLRQKVTRASTALVRRSTARPAQKKSAQQPGLVLPNVLPESERNLTDDIMLGGLGLVDIKLTPAEEAILAEPVNAKDIQVKPTGQPYLSHPAYTRWFGRAFGRLGWALVPASKPAKAIQGKKISVVVPYVLYIHGQPAAFAQGEQDYYEDNAEQTYGDALESTVASGLRRCAKRLGVGLEMWDRQFLEAFLKSFCVHVQIEIKKRGSDETEKKWVWRLKGAAPLWNEVGRGSRRGDAPPVVDPPTDRREKRPDGRTSTVPAEARVTHKDEHEKITIEQRQRLAMIVRNSDRSDEEINVWLRTSFANIDNVKPSRDILRRDYDAIVKAIEAPGALPAWRR